MKKKAISILLTLAMCLSLLPATALAADPAADPAEQFSGLTSGGTYWFDLSKEGIPDTVNSNLPDNSLHWVPFTYAGTVNAYKRTDAGVSTEDSVTPYLHSLFIADYAVNHKVSWDTLNGEKLIFGKSYNSGGVDYTLRAPSAGSSGTNSGGTPASNEWNAIFYKNSEYIKNWDAMYSWGQDTSQTELSYRAVRGYFSAHDFFHINATYRNVPAGFRPVLELPSADTLGSDGLTTVTLDLNGGHVGSDATAVTVNLAVKSSGTYTAPSGDGLTAPAGKVFARWKAANSENIYAPGDNVPADVTRLTAIWELSDIEAPPEQFTPLTLGGTYWFDLSEVDIPGSVNSDLPDNSLRWVPFTYAGTVNAYVLNKNSGGVMNASEQAANTNDPNGQYGYTYDHSLFIADYSVTQAVSWNKLNEKNLIFGKSYTSGGVDYTLRAPSAGSSGNQGGTPASNEWDVILDKNSEYIQHWMFLYSWGQDTYHSGSSSRASRGHVSPRNGIFLSASHQEGDGAFRPVLEILDSDGLTTVTLDLNGGSIGSITGTVNLAVKSDFMLTLPGGTDVTRPDGNDGAYFKWQDSSGNFYEPGDTVPAGVTRLTARWAPPEQFTTLTPGGTYWFDLSGVDIPGTVNEGNDNGAVAVPDKTLRWVPFTYAGTVDAYVLKAASSGVMDASEQAANTTSPDGQYGYTYDHSLFIANYNVTHTVSWNELNGEDLIFGKSYTSGGVDYTLRAPSVGGGKRGDILDPGTPASNEWDVILDKYDWYIQYWKFIHSWGQDTCQDEAPSRAIRGLKSARYWYYRTASGQTTLLGFRPVLEILNPGTLGSDGLTTVTLDLNGGSIGSITGTVNLAVKSSGTYLAPGSDGLTRPTGITGTNFKWQDSSGIFYRPGDTVPADVTRLTARWEKDVPTATANDITVTYTGSAVPDSAITGTASVEGSWRFKNAAPVNVTDSSDSVTVVFTPADTNTYETVEDIIKVTINEATPTGTPAYTATKTEKNPDGSTTTTVTDKTTGTVTETTKNTNGSTTVVETKKDGTVTETNKAADGTTGTVVTDKNGDVTEVKASVSSAAAEEAAKTGGAVTLPVEVPAAKTTGDAPAVDVSVPKNSGSVKVEIPVGKVTPGTVAVIVNADGTEEIVKTSIPTENGVALTLDGSATVKVIDNVKVFEDIHSDNHWAEDAVDFVVARGMFAGTSETTFSPNSNMTRAMLMTVLARFDGEDTSGGSVWYEKGMEWAKANGVSDGSNPDAPITREQLAVMLWRYAGSPTSSHGLDGYTDADQISGYALEAMRWANENGIVNGYGNGILGAKDNATRAQVAQMLMNFVKCLNQ